MDGHSLARLGVRVAFAGALGAPFGFGELVLFVLDLDQLEQLRILWPAILAVDLQAVWLVIVQPHAAPRAEKTSRVADAAVVQRARLTTNRLRAEGALRRAAVEWLGIRMRRRLNQRHAAKHRRAVLEAGRDVSVRGGIRSTLTRDGVDGPDGTAILARAVAAHHLATLRTETHGKILPSRPRSRGPHSAGNDFF